MMRGDVVIRMDVVKDWIPAFAGMTMVLLLTEYYRRRSACHLVIGRWCARHPGESRDPSTFVLRATLSHSRAL